MLKEYIKKFERNSIVSSLLMIVLALFFIFKPIKTLNTLMIIFGMIICLLGLLELISYFRLDKESRLFSFNFIQGLLEIIAGILIIFNADILTSFLPIVIGVWIIVSNLLRCQMAINLSQIGGKYWILLFTLSILMMILGVITLINPFASTLAITLVVGTVLLIAELFNLIESIYILVKIKF